MSAFPLPSSLKMASTAIPSVLSRLRSLVARHAKGSETLLIYFFLLALIAGIALFASPARAQSSPDLSLPANPNLAVPTPAVTAIPATNVTFGFTADVHVSFNGNDDHQGIDDDVINQKGNAYDALLVLNETAPSTTNLVSHHDGCVGTGFSFEKDLCNQIQLVRKLNHTPTNRWYPTAFSQSGFPTWATPTTHLPSYSISQKFASAGQPIGDLAGVVIGGDLTDCGAGSYNTLGSQACDIDYLSSGTEGEQLTLFRRLFDKNSQPSYALNYLNVIQGLYSPDSDAPLHFPIYPGLGNHDLGFHQSPMMLSYVKQWNDTQSPTSPYKVLDSDPNSGSYSWNWGGLHLINVGVFAGSNNESHDTDQNYAYSSDAMYWLIYDLKTYASDGRPVIIFQHFGFEPFSFSSSWYGASSRSNAIPNLWQAIAPYNVIGIFHGHVHSQGFYKFSPGSTYTSNNQLISSNTLPYDIFVPGPGYKQDFAVIHVANKSMDVQATLNGDDFDNSHTNVNWGQFFSKRLVQPPVGTLPAPVESGDILATSATTGATRYLIGVGANAKYTVRQLLANGNYNLLTTDTKILSTGTFKIVPRFLLSYTLGGFAYVIAANTNSQYFYKIQPDGSLSYVFYANEPIHSLAVVQDPAGNPIVIYDDANHPANTARFLFFQLNPAKYALIGDISLPAKTSAFTQLAASQLVASGSFRLFRILPNGSTEIYNGAIGLTEIPTLALGNTELWQKDAVYTNPASFRAHVLAQPVILADKTIGLVVKSAPCVIVLSNGTCIANPYDSPFSIRTLTQDGSATQISWRGQPAILNSAYNAKIVSLLDLGRVNGVPQVGAYTSNGALLFLNIQN